jgi:hypothetical protein
MASAVVRCSSCSMPSARTIPPVRSTSAFTAFTISAISVFGRAWMRRMSSFTTSGRRKGMSAREWRLAPTSSSAMPQPRSRMRSTDRSSSAGLAASARSVISTTTRSFDCARL